MQRTSPLLLCLLLSILPLRAQSLHDWSRVERLSAGTALHVHAARGDLRCSLVSADADSLMCRGSYHVFTGRQSYTVARGDVRSIRGSRQALSTLTGAAIGLGAGIGIGAGVDAAHTGTDDPHAAAIAFGLVGPILGGAVGASTDFLAGPLFYQQ